MGFNKKEELQEEQNELEKEGFVNDELTNPLFDEKFNEAEYKSRLANPFDDENINEEEEVTENPSSKFHESPIEEAKGQMKKKAFATLLKNPYFLTIIGGIFFVLFVAIIIFHLDFDIFGVGKPKPKHYQTPSCGKVFLTWEKESYTKAHENDPNYKPITDPLSVNLADEERFDYKPYDYNTYIAGIIWTDNYDAKDIDNKIVYQAMAIAARSRLFSELPENCVVLKEYNEQASHFTELTGSEEKYSEIMEAIRLSKGILIGRKKTPINAQYDTFTYVKKIKDYDENYNSTFFYHMMNENKEKQQMIPADWIDELEKKKGVKIPKKHENHYLMLESMSLYGAKYLLEQTDSQYELYRILEYYYGRDIEYYTIDSNFSISGGGFFYGSSGCMWWPIGSLDTTIEDGITYAKGLPSATTISSPFGYRNLSLPDATTNHQAIDISGGGRDGYHNIIAAADGEVIGINTGCVAGDSGCGGRLGNYVKIQHSDGTITRYGHLYSVSVSNGDKVKQGQVLGKMGKTGNVTGVHLDFQVVVNGDPVNPLDYVSVSAARVQCLGSVTGNYTGTGKQEFISFIAGFAVEDMHSSGILASVTIAQAILESNWGKSSLSKDYNNFFGMKAGSSWKGQVVELPTTECDANGCYPTTATWRVYDNPLKSLQDHSNLLHNNRYSGVVGETDYLQAITIIKNGGYATDPGYIKKIVSIIESYNLAEYDRM